jgi:hypothetical protein
MNNSAKSIYFSENKVERDEKSTAFFDLFGGPIEPLPIICKREAGSILGYSA